MRAVVGLVAVTLLASMVLLATRARPQSAPPDAFTRVSALLQKARLDKAKALLAELERRAPPAPGPLDPQQRDYWTFLTDLYRSLGRTKELDQLLVGRPAASRAR